MFRTILRIEIGIACCIIVKLGSIVIKGQIHQSAVLGICCFRQIYRIGLACKQPVISLGVIIILGRVSCCLHTFLNLTSGYVLGKLSRLSILDTCESTA